MNIKYYWGELILKFYLTQEPEIHTNNIWQSVLPFSADFRILASGSGGHKSTIFKTKNSPISELTHVIFKEIEYERRQKY